MLVARPALPRASAPWSEAISHRIACTLWSASRSQETSCIGVAHPELQCMDSEMLTHLIKARQSELATMYTQGLTLEEAGLAEGWVEAGWVEAGWAEEGWAEGGWVVEDLVGTGDWAGAEGGWAGGGGLVGGGEEAAHTKLAGTGWKAESPGMAARFPAAAMLAFLHLANAETRTGMHEEHMSTYKAWVSRHLLCKV